MTSRADEAPDLDILETQQSAVLFEQRNLRKPISSHATKGAATPVRPVAKHSTPKRRHGPRVASQSELPERWKRRMVLSFSDKRDFGMTSQSLSKKVSIPGSSITMHKKLIPERP